MSSELSHFSQQASALDAAHAQLVEQADARELARMPAEELGARLAQLANYRYTNKLLHIHRNINY